MGDQIHRLGPEYMVASSPAYSARLLVRETSTFSKPCDVVAPMRSNEKDETESSGMPAANCRESSFLSFLLISTSVPQFSSRSIETYETHARWNSRLADRLPRYPLIRRNTCLAVSFVRDTAGMRKKNEKIDYTYVICRGFTTKWLFRGIISTNDSLKRGSSATLTITFRHSRTNKRKLYKYLHHFCSCGNFFLLF